MTHLLILGDVLLDRDVEADVRRVMPDAPGPVLEEREVRTRPGGAGLAALLARRDGADVTLVTAIGGDGAGEELRGSLRRAGVDVVDLELAAPTPEKIRLRAGGTSLARWDRGAAAPAPDQIGALTSTARERIEAADGVLVSCYGRGITARADVRAALVEAARQRPVIWDPHPLGPAPVPSCALVTPNAAESATFVPEVPGAGLDAITARADLLVERWASASVAVTLGADGALLSTGHGLPFMAPVPFAVSGDTCGAGDRFASAAARYLTDGAVPSSAVVAAVQASARYVADGGAAGLARPRVTDAPAPPGDARRIAQEVRARGGTVVATGGCFDLVHAGHVHLLEAARALGDCLIVCVNSDASVRRLKGPDRPVVAEADRVELLEALSCVDAVVVFDEDTPVEALRRLRPDVFAKGGDYGSTWIPEADVLATWGGQAVVLPYLQGRSTTRILEEVRGRGTA